MPLKKRKLTPVKGAETPAAPAAGESVRIPVSAAAPEAPREALPRKERPAAIPADPRGAWARMRARSRVSGAVFSMVGGLAVAAAAFLALGSMSGFRVSLDFRDWIPAAMRAAGVEAKKVNVLVAGVGGASNDAPWLTDSLILASFDPDRGAVSFLSVPRDLYVNDAQLGAGKINGLYARGRARLGAEKAARNLMDKVSEITGEPVDAYVIADFDGFVKLVDTLGGVDVDVPEAVTDTQYPDGNWGYETFSISAGPHRLDGATALKYVRSRHSTSDFDRSARQQIVLRALKDRATSLSIAASPSRLRGIFSAVSEHVTTNLSLGDVIGLAAGAAGKRDLKVVGRNLNDACWQNGPCEAGALLYAPSRDVFGGESVLLPNASDGRTISAYGEIRKLAYLVYHLPEMFSDPKPVRVLNATKEPGLAGVAATELRRYGFSVPYGSGTASLTGAKAPESTLLRYRPGLEESPTMEALSLFFPGPREAYGSGEVSAFDFEIVLAKDAKSILK